MIFSRLLDQLRDPLRRLCANAHPIIHSLQIHTQHLCLTLSYGIEETHALDEPTSRDDERSATVM